jgi:hypothetical protein
MLSPRLAAHGERWSWALLLRWRDEGELTEAACAAALARVGDLDLVRVIAGTGGGQRGPIGGTPAPDGSTPRQLACGSTELPLLQILPRPPA